jgi:hypothetical protein
LAFRDKPAGSKFKDTNVWPIHKYAWKDLFRAAFRPNVRNLSPAHIEKIATAFEISLSGSFGQQPVPNGRKKSLRQYQGDCVFVVHFGERAAGAWVHSCRGTELFFKGTANNFGR